jgi:hypothetical protein
MRNAPRGWGYGVCGENRNTWRKPSTCRKSLTAIRSRRDRMVVRFQLPMKSVPIILNPTQAGCTR